MTITPIRPTSTQPIEVPAVPMTADQYRQGDTVRTLSGTIGTVTRTPLPGATLVVVALVDGPARYSVARMPAARVALVARDPMAREPWWTSVPGPLVAPWRTAGSTDQGSAS